jgi:hypothetical protein
MVAKSDIFQEFVMYWNAQSIEIAPYSGKQRALLRRDTKGRPLPPPLIELYSSINGMKPKFPNDFDQNGFLIYPLSEVKSAEEEFQSKAPPDFPPCFIFADYLHKSWYYGITHNLNSDDFEVVLVYEPFNYSKVADSLYEFFKLYLVDDERIYEF